MAPRLVSPGGAAILVKISRKLPRAGLKRRAAPATAAAITESGVDPKKSRYGTQTPWEEKRSGPSERALWGVLRKGLVVVAPVPSASTSGDAIGTCYNWSAIGASPVRPQTRAPPAQIKVALGVTCASTCRTVAQSLGWFTHLVRPRPSSRGGSV